MPDGHDHIHRLLQKSLFCLMMTTPVQRQARVCSDMIYHYGNGRVPDGLGRQCSVPVEGAGLWQQGAGQGAGLFQTGHNGAKRAIDELMRSKRYREVNKLPRENMKWRYT
jgi:hypothetical protein